LEAQEDADAATSPSKDIGPCCQQRLFPFKENNPNHHNHHHNDHDHHNNDHNDHDHTSVEYKPDNKSSDTTSAAHHHLSPSLNLHGSDRQARSSSFSKCGAISEQQQGLMWPANCDAALQ